MPGPGDVNVVDVITLVAFAVLVLCVARYGRAISVDLIGLPIRAWAEEKFTRASKVYKLVTCYWCNVYWISLLKCCLAAVLASLYWHNWWLMALVPFVFPAVAYAASWVIEKTVD